MEKYIEKTPLSIVPLNQFRKASRKRICKELGITYSTIGSNPNLAAVFEKLDIILGSVPDKQAPRRTKDIQHLEETIKLLENQVIKLRVENSSLLSEIKRYEHFVSSGRMAR